jgi:molybdenum cofactor cytidylyltransferase
VSVRRKGERGRGEDGPRPSVLLLAAGTSSRFLGTKQLARIAGKTLVESALDRIPTAEVGDTVVVVGHEAAAVTEAIGKRHGVAIVLNSGYREGMASSIRTGMSALATDANAVMIVLADQPFLTKPLLRRILRAFEARGSNGIVAAARAGTVAPPAVFSRKYFGELAGLTGDQGARSVIVRHQADASLVNVRSRHTLADVDTQEDLEAARRLLEP